MDGVPVQSDLLEQQRPLVAGTVGVIWGSFEGLALRVFQVGDLHVGVGQGGGVASDADRGGGGGKEGARGVVDVLLVLGGQCVLRLGKVAGVAARVRL